ncbi:hypothetical protein MAPG_01377 [Magnaporthiopsis poae ATCC 64411]|uniref:Uncharacterized protein n=1 Tax=Magnaporthiopsis poae (strain ATCC 64411 / 73-15) TaxID=644358 RepID=A0A0C4DNJ0_MAGP6|nr:hypothetical protein MAPG_01377 [Magnaporthiopsis poae ATCC 64411]
MAARPAAKKVEVTPRSPMPPPMTLPRGPAIKVRRYGQNDFDKFDEENARGSFLPVGSESVGKVEIECKYRWRQSQWGILGPQNPAGIVYMDIVFHQPDGYWLKNATVWITMGEDEKSTYARGSPKKRLGADEYAVQISEHYGPESLTGGKTSRTETKTTSLNPKVSILNVADIEGFSRTSEHTQERSKSWKFSGNVRRPQGCAGYRTLKWELIENDFDPDQPHSQEYRTAFAFEHSQRPVYMRVEIEGNLGRKSKRVWQNVNKRFSSCLGNKDKSTLTYIDLSKGPRSTYPLDELARSLKMAMELENYKNVPVVVPDPAPAKFFPDDDWAGNSPPEAGREQGTAEMVKSRLVASSSDVTTRWAPGEVPMAQFSSERVRQVCLAGVAQVMELPVSMKRLKVVAPILTGVV